MENYKFKWLASTMVASHSRQAQIVSLILNVIATNVDLTNKQGGFAPYLAQYLL